MSKINPYLNFAGDCKDAFERYKEIFGGEFSAISTFADVPSGEGLEVTEEEKGRIMHVSLPIGGDMLMGSDSMPGMETIRGNNMSVSFHPESEADARRVFDALAEGGTVTVPLEKTFWDALFGMCTDKFGINWMVNYDLSTE